MKSFRDREILITGAGSGIGRATALAFAAEGASLWLADLDEQGNAETAEQARRAGARARTFHCDVADEQSVRALAEAVHERIDALDILMNNAGIGSAGRFLDTSLETWRRVMDVNLMGVVHGCHAFLPAMVEQGRGGHVINVASAAGYFAAPDMPVYAASKFAVQGFSEALRADMASHGIGVSTICPGIINTGIVANSIMEGRMGDPERHGKIVDFYRKRNFTAEDVAKSVLRAVRGNRAVQPVSAEAWGLYYAKRFAPRLLQKVSEKEPPFLK